MENGEKTKTKAFSFFTLSTLFHVALAIGIAHLTYKASQKLPKVTEVEFMAPAEASAEAGIADTQPAPVETASAPVEKVEPSIAPVAEEAAPVMASALPEKTKTKKVAVKAQSTPKAVVKAQEPVVEETPEEAPVVEATPVVENVDTAPEQQPEEEKAEVAAAVPVETTPANEDTKPEVDTQAQKEELDQMADKYSADADEQFKQAEKDLAESQMAEARALEDQAAKDKLAAEAAKKAEADQAAQAAAAAAAANVAATPQSSGGEKPQTAQAGTGSEPVRSVADLKQVPGNKKPAYDVSDRKAGRAGEVIFTAYVTKAGTLSDFKMVKSSGHRSLDAKSLAALKSWKFQPNQEGRTELGFKWDLKGEAVEMPAALRR